MEPALSRREPVARADAESVRLSDLLRAIRVHEGGGMRQQLTHDEMLAEQRAYDAAHELLYDNNHLLTGPMLISRLPRTRWNAAELVAAVFPEDRWAVPG